MSPAMQEIEITPEMICEGEIVLDSLLGVVSLGYAVSQVYTAMAQRHLKDHHAAIWVLYFLGFDAEM